jgi:prepilin-type N-terminal cleavage/methylation domain-containing protein
VRALRQDGYSVVELLVVTAVVGLIAAGTLGVYQTSQHVYQRATALEDAQLRARAGVALMVRDLQLIGAYWTGAGGAGPAILAASDTSITFMADVNGETVNNGVDMTTVTATRPGATAVTLSASATRLKDAFNMYTSPALNDFLYIASGNRREVRQVTGITGSTVSLTTPITGSYPAGSLVRAVEKVTYAFNSTTRTLTRSVGGSGAQGVINQVSALAMSFFDGHHPGAATSDLPRIREIRVSLTTVADDGTPRTMVSRVRVRN